MNDKKRRLFKSVNMYGRSIDCMLPVDGGDREIADSNYKLPFS